LRIIFYPDIQRIFALNFKLIAVFFGRPAARGVE